MDALEKAVRIPLIGKGGWKDEDKGRYDLSCGAFHVAVVGVGTLRDAMDADRKEILRRACRHNPASVAARLEEYLTMRAELEEAKAAMDAVLAMHVPMGTLGNGMPVPEALAVDIRWATTCRDQLEKLLNIPVGVGLDWSLSNVSMPDDEKWKWHFMEFSPEEIRAAATDGRLECGDMFAASEAKAAAMEASGGKCFYCGRTREEAGGLGTWSLTAPSDCKRTRYGDHISEFTRDPDGFVHAMCPDCAGIWLARSNELVSIEHKEDPWALAMGNSQWMRRIDRNSAEYKASGEALEAEAVRYIAEARAKAGEAEPVDRLRAETLLAGLPAYVPGDGLAGALPEGLDVSRCKTLDEALDALNEYFRPLVARLGETVRVWDDQQVPDISKARQEDLRYFAARYAKCHPDVVKALCIARSGNLWAAKAYDQAFRRVCDMFDKDRGGYLDDFRYLKSKYMEIVTESWHGVLVSDPERSMFVGCSLDWMAKKAGIEVG